MDLSQTDIVNSIFETGGGIVLWSHVRVILKEKKVLGVSILPFIFYTIWGVWNLYYYDRLGQPLSVYGGVFVFIVNALYTWLLFYYRVIVPRREKKALPTP